MANKKSLNRWPRTLAAVATLCILWATFSCAAMYVCTEDPISPADGMLQRFFGATNRFTDNLFCSSSFIDLLPAPLSPQFHHTALFNTFREPAGRCAVAPSLKVFSSFITCLSRFDFVCCHPSSHFLQDDGPSPLTTKSATTQSCMDLNYCAAGETAPSDCSGVGGWVANYPHSSSSPSAPFARPTPQELAAARQVRMNSVCLLFMLLSLAGRGVRSHCVCLSISRNLISNNSFSPFLTPRFSAWQRPSPFLC